jgi:hypothetical protein
MGVVMKKLLFTLLLLFPLQTFAAQENWYTYWSIGAADNKYPSNLNATLDFLDSLPGVDRSQGSIDMFGFYFPRENNLALGFVISGSWDLFQTPVGDMQINQYLYGFSAMKFFGKEIGDGFFLRGDIGLSKAVVHDDYYGTSSSDTGLGTLLGAGFGIPISEETRILFGLNVSNKDVDGDNWTAVTLNIGGLW